MSEKVLITKTSMDAIGNAIRFMRDEETEYLPSEMPNAIRSIQPALVSKTVTENGDYYPPEGVDGFSELHVNVSGGGGVAVIQPLSVTQNGTYNPPSGVDGYAPVTVLVPSSGGEGPIYYGTSAPSASIGTDEDLYIQYEAKSSAYNYLYGIVAKYRKVSGVWVEYTEPELPTKGVHIWTKSTGGNDAAMYVQNGYWDYDSNTFIATGEIESVIYTSVTSTPKNCNGVVFLGYGNWYIRAITTVTDGVNTYQPNDTVATWVYNQQKDIYVFKPQ